MSHDDDREKAEDLPAGGKARQRRRAFLEKRGLPPEGEAEGEPTSQQGGPSEPADEEVVPEGHHTAESEDR